MDESPATSVQAAPDPVLDRLRAVTLGEYEILGELGRGGMATVYLAHEIALGRKVAIKVMAPGLMLGAGMTERFKREARTAANLSHPNIIPVYSVREAGDLLFFVMKLVEGTPLDSIMRELKELPVPMVEAILAQVGGAFGYAHRRGVVHRDIKPSNILIDEEGWAVVTDFGIAKVAESEGLTQTGMSVGTPTYMSPEQAGATTLDGRSDQYSLGVVAYEMLTGRPPFSGTMVALIYSHCHEPVPSLTTLRPDCPPGLAAAVMRMLEKDPAARWPTMEEAVAGMGPGSLADDDPTRSQLILLARSGTTHRIVSQVQTPRSPIPLRTTGQRTAAAPVSRRRLSGLLTTAAVALFAVGAYLVFRARGAALDGTGGADSTAIPPVAAPAPAPPAAGPAGKVLPPETRPNPPTGRATPPAPAPPNRIVSGAARDTARGTVSPVPPPARQPPPPPPPVAPRDTTRLPAPVAPPPNPVVVTPIVDERAQVTAAIQAYARALEAGDLAQAQRAYPGMPADQRQGLEAFWKAGGTMRPVWSISDVVVTGETATARVTGSTSVTTREGASQQRVSLRARLERRGTEWRLVALVN